MTELPPLVQITLGQVVSILAGISAFIAIVAGAFRLGGLTQRVDTNERTVIQRLDQFAERFSMFEGYISSASLARQEWAGWRSGVDQQISQVREEQDRHAKNNHEIRNILNEHETRLGIIESQK